MGLTDADLYGYAVIVGTAIFGSLLVIAIVTMGGRKNRSSRKSGWRRM